MISLKLVADGDRGWIGARSPYALWIGSLRADLARVPAAADVVVIDDLRVTGRWATRFSFPYRNPSLLERGDLRGSVFLRASPGRQGEWTLESWNARARELLSNPETTVALLPQTYRWVFLEKRAYRLRDAPAVSRGADSIRVVVCYRDRSDLTVGLIGDLAEQRFTAATVELVLVDNQSRADENDRVLQAAKSLPAPWRVVFLKYDHPYNHSAQNNLGVDGSSAEVFFLLNNDVRLRTPKLIQELSDRALTPGTATAGPRVTGSRGLVSAGIQIEPRADQPGGVGLCESPCPIYSTELRVTSGNSFACAAVNAEVFRAIGGLDAEAFPTQYNDADFLLKAAKRGLTHLLVGSEAIFHQPGQSDTGRSRDDVLRAYRRLLDRHRELPLYLNRDPRTTTLKTEASLPEAARRVRAFFRRPNVVEGAP